MILTTTARAELERRSARAASLPPSPITAFLATLCRAQASIAANLECGGHAAALDDLMPLIEPFLRTIAEKGPAQLVEQALARLDDDAATARARLMTYWRGDATAREDYLSRAILRPYTEVLRQRGVTLDRLHNPGHCPYCGGKPIVSTRRAPADAEAGLRMLHCGLCGLEWNYNRGQCPSCEEQNPDKLPVFQSDAHPNVRLEACETCRRYVKSIDLTKDLRPIAEIDDVLSLSMDLWAMDEGLTRIEPGLAGV